MTQKVIGILGGMGPEATLDCFGTQRLANHLRVLGAQGTSHNASYIIGLENFSRRN